MRLRALLTGRCTWIDADTGEVEHDLLSWRSRWALFGVHSYNWGWVTRYGKRDCGCTFNPVTRRKVLTNMDCPAHGIPMWKRDSVWDDEFAQAWENDEEWEDKWT
jgi:hypothetical protein